MKFYSLLLILVIICIYCDYLKASCSTWSTCDNGDVRRDLRTLQNLLEWELMQQSFYQQGVSVFAGNITGIPENEFDTFEQFKIHTDSYVQNLTTIINSKEGSPVQNCSLYQFNFEDDAAIFLNKTIQFETWGNSLYLGAIANVSNPALKILFASIASVKARHVAWLSTILGANPFVSSLDNPLSFQTVKRLVVQADNRIQECPQENSQCFGLDSNDDNVCGGTSQGRCIAKDVCLCKTGFTGSNCTEPCRRGSNRCYQCSNSCCNDVRLGNVCFSDRTHTCLASPEDTNTFVLCGKRENVCNLWCFDNNLYNCIDGILLLK